MAYVLDVLVVLLDLIIGDELEFELELELFELELLDEPDEELSDL